MRLTERQGKIRMGIGIENYREMREKGNYYVDKTRLIAEYLEAEDKVTLLMRPRRFGKTLNMSMLAEFFDITKDSADIFEGTEIMGTKWVSEMNQYPVISLSFANVRGDSEEFLVEFLALEIRREYMRYEFLWEEKKVPENMGRALSEIYKSLWSTKISDRGVYLTKSITELCRALELYYGKK